MNGQKHDGGITMSVRVLIIIIVVAVVLMAVAFALAANWNDWFDKILANFGDSKPESVLKPDIDPNAGNWVETTPPSNGGVAVGIKIPGYPSITIAANRTDVTMALLNPEGNPCYFTFEIVLNDTGETIYQSKQVPPGKVISAVTLTRALAPGEYNATIKISTNAIEDMRAMNGANVETLLIAK